MNELVEGGFMRGVNRNGSFTHTHTHTHKHIHTHTQTHTHTHINTRTHPLTCIVKSKMFFQNRYLNLTEKIHTEIITKHYGTLIDIIIDL